MAGILGTAAGLGANVGTMTAGAAASSQIGDLGMGLQSAQNADSTKQIMQQGMLSAIRSFAEAISKTLKAGADSVKGLV